MVPLLSTGALAGVLYLLGTRFVARTAGAVGRTGRPGHPLVFVNLTRGYPDLTATTLVGTGDPAGDPGPGPGHGPPMRRAAYGGPVACLLLAACGFVTAWSFEVRETAVFAWPVIGWILWGSGGPCARWRGSRPPPWRWLALDLWLCASIYGDPWLKLAACSPGADISTSVVTADSVYVGHSRWWYATILPRSIWRCPGGPALVACLVVGLVGGVVLPGAARPDLGLGRARPRPAVAAGRPARPRPSLGAPGRRTLLAVVHGPAAAGRRVHPGHRVRASRRAPQAALATWRSVALGPVWPSPRSRFAAT